MKPQHLFPTLLIGSSSILPLQHQAEARRIAIIGGGISGTFAAKYLADYDANHRSSSASSSSASSASSSSSSSSGGEGGEARDCLIDEIVVYDVSPPPTGLSNEEGGHGYDTREVRSSSDPRPPNYQGSRVSSITLNDGTVMELGASIVYNGNRLVLDTMNGDPERLKKAKPGGGGGNNPGESKEEEGTGKHNKGATATTQTQQRQPSGVGIYHGQNEWLLNTASFSTYPSILRAPLKSLYFLWRYNFDYFRLNSAVKQAIRSFDVIYDALNDTRHDVTYFDSPMDMWGAMGLKSAAGISFHDFLDGLGLYRDVALELESDHNNPSGWSSWLDWRKWIPGMGCLRAELLSAITINTYNQDLNAMNGLVGLVAYVPVGGEVFSIAGGNHQLMESALSQGQVVYDSSTCQNTAHQRIQQRQHRITTVVADQNTMRLYEEQEALGEYDIVILAAPLQQCRIQFLIESPMGLDEAILHEMPLGGVIDNVDAEDVPDERKDEDTASNNEHGHHSFARELPQSATMPYTSVVTTVVSNATLNAAHFGLRDDDVWPRSILVSERGRALEGITTLTIYNMDRGIIKTFSSDTLGEEQRNAIFGEHHVLEYVQVWGGGDNGKYGGATPNFGGGRHSESLPYLLYDGAKHWSREGGAGRGDSHGGPALYYSNAIESAVAAIEISAIGAKSTAKLVARRLGLIRPQRDSAAHDEL